MVHLAQEGDREAFAELMRRFGPMALGYLRGRTRRREDVEDILQDVYLLTLTRIATLKKPERFGPWLLVIAKNRLRDFLRRQAREARLAPQGAPAMETGRPAPGNGAQPDGAEAAMTAINALGDKYRVIVYMRLIAEEPLQEIAQRLALKESTVRMRYKRGLEKVRRKLERQGIHSAEVAYDSSA